MEMQRSNCMRSILRLPAKLLVISVRTLANLQVKLTDTSKFATGLLSSLANSLASSLASSIANSRPIVPPRLLSAPLGGGIRSREARVNIPLFPRLVLPDGPPNARGPSEVLVGLFTDFSDFLGRYSSQ